LYSSGRRGARPRPPALGSERDIVVGGGRRALAGLVGRTGVAASAEAAGLAAAFTAATFATTFAAPAAQEDDPVGDDVGGVVLLPSLS